MNAALDPPPLALVFEARFVRELPGDAEKENFTRSVQGAAYSLVAPTPVPAPRLLATSRELAAELGLSPADMERRELVEALAGNRLLPGMVPYAACYGGHQFGHWAGQLGDGRAITLGELVTPSGRALEVQLKGAGPTPYSRRADGRAVLRSSLREFLCSEAMHHLGVPTTRALALVATGEAVERDMLYDGHPKLEPGAIVTRVAPSFLRLGNFELPASRGDVELLRALVSYALRHHFPEIGSGDREVTPARVVALLAEVVRRTARLMAHWMRVGFVHGVMNTDNLSVLGLTIDYGPYGWLEPFDPSWTPNTTDAAGRRYRFGNQPRIAAWNLACFAGALHPLVGEEAPLEEALAEYAPEFERAYRGHLVEKLGWAEWRPQDEPLVDELFALLQAAGLDMTCFFRALTEVPVESLAARAPTPDEVTRWFEPALYDPAVLEGDVGERFRRWLAAWAGRVAESGPVGERVARMRAVNPRFVLRNYLAQEAIDAAEQGDTSLLHRLQEVLRHPYDDQPGEERFAARRPEWARHRVGCSMLSCSS